MWLAQKFNEGGVFMYFIAIFGVLSFTLIIERYFTLFKKESEPKTTFRNQLLSFISQGDFNSAIRFTENQNASDSASLSRIAKIGCTLRSQGAGDEAARPALGRAASGGRPAPWGAARPAGRAAPRAGPWR